MASDAFCRLRVAEPFTIFDYYPSPASALAVSTFDQDIWVTTNNGSGATTYNSANYINMQIAATGDYVVRKTKQPMEYEPGKSRVIMITGVLLDTAPGANTIISRMGLFNLDTATPPVPSAGVYVETDGTNLYWCEVTQLATTRVIQGSWNIDTFDGSGPSGFTLSTSNISQTLLIVIDQEWLGVGRIRVGFILNGIIYYAHQFTHTGLAVQYTVTPRLRICYQIVGTAITGTNNLRQMCCTCQIEGGFVPLGKRNNCKTTISGVPLTTASTQYIVLALKLQSAFPNGLLKFIRASFLFSAATSRICLYTIQLHSTNGLVGSISTSMSFTNLRDSAAQYSIGSGQTIVTDGYILSSGFVSGQSEASFDNADFETLLKRSMVTEYDTLYVTAISGSNTEVAYCAIDFIESL